MPKRRGRSESMIKLANQIKEAKLWYEEANNQMKADNLYKALNSYNKALELNPVEKNALVARSKCYILLGQPKNGLKDAESALVIDKCFIKAIYQKAEALYYLGDFEHSLMYYHRGLKLRPDHEGFKLGVHKAQKAIENAIGGISSSSNTSSSSNQSNHSSPPSIKSSSKQSTAREQNNNNINIKEKERNTQTPDTINDDGLISKSTVLKSNAKSASGHHQKKAKKNSRLLRELAVDKEYLDNLLTNPNIKCKCKDNDDSIIEYIKEAVDFLNTRQEFWKQQLPPHLK